MFERDYELTHVKDELTHTTNVKLTSTHQLELKEDELHDMCTYGIKEIKGGE